MSPIRFDFFVWNHTAGFEIDEENTTGLQPTLFDHSLGRYIDYADLRGHDAFIIVCNVVARGPQTVSVEDGSDIGSIRKCNRCGSVPRLQYAGVVFIKRFFIGSHCGVLLPGLWDHHEDGFLEGPSCHAQEFENVVERAGVRAVGFDHWEELL